MRTILTVSLFLAACLAGCAQPSTTFEIDPVTKKITLHTTVDRNIEGLDATISEGTDANGKAYSTSHIAITKSETSASAVINADAQRLRVAMEGGAAIGGSVAEGITKGLKPVP